MAPLVVNKEKEGEDCDNETRDDEHHHDQTAVHLPLLHCQLFTLTRTSERLPDSSKTPLKVLLSYHLHCRESIG